MTIAKKLLFAYRTVQNISCFLFTGPKPSELYGRYTWKIEKFSQITKRELRSSAFEVGGHKWYEALHIIGLT